MIAMTLGEIAAAVGGRVVGGEADTLVTGPVEFDSREIRPGGLFIAFPGTHVDGHDFAADAGARGAVATLGTREVVGPSIMVADATVAMAALARALVQRLSQRGGLSGTGLSGTGLGGTGLGGTGLGVVGITGSSGKTTTKDLIAQLLARRGSTVAPTGSYNNELGLPHTVLRCDEATRFLVLEMGSRGPGDLTYLCGIAPPRIGVVVNVGVAHIGEFGSVDAIAAAKGELVAALPADGVAVLNADDERVRAMASLTSARVVRVGESHWVRPGDGVGPGNGASPGHRGPGGEDPRNVDLRAVDVRLDERGRPSFTLVTPEGQADVRLGVSGRHQVGNSLLAAAVARECGMPLADLAPALGDLRLVSSRRMDVFDRPDGVTVIDDSYNANPASTATALAALVAIGRGRRRVAVLGYLAELGEQERAGHEQVGRLAAELGVDQVVVVGANAAGIHDGAVAVASWGGESVQVSDQEEAVALLRERLRPGDVVLVKGSRYRTWAIADALRGDQSYSADPLRGDRSCRADALRGDRVMAVDEVVAP